MLDLSLPGKVFSVWIIFTAVIHLWLLSFWGYHLQRPETWWTAVVVRQHNYSITVSREKLCLVWLSFPKGIKQNLYLPKGTEKQWKCSCHDLGLYLYSTISQQHHEEKSNKEGGLIITGQQHWWNFTELKALSIGNGSNCFGALRK